MPVLTAIDVLGVQSYVFASNRLRDVVSASSLVRWATAREGALRETAEVLFAAGGNAILEMPDLQRAQAFAGAYSRRLIDHAPALEVAIVHRSYESGGLAAALAELQEQVARAKLGRVPSAEQLGIGVHASCSITGLPAVAADADGPISSQVASWRDPRVRDRCANGWSAPAPFGFPLLIESLGRSRGDTSLLGVVHLDGNGVGASIRSWLEAQQGAADDAVRDGYRAWSAALDERVAATWDAVVERIRRSVVNDAVRGRHPDLVLALGREEGRQCLPVRPVLAGGDDLTFLCDGRLALDLAAAALDVFGAFDVAHLGRGSACAGVALVPIHFPFSRAYELAEQLCRSAKAGRRAQDDRGAWLDWQIGPPTPGESVGAARERRLRTRVGDRDLELRCRPYRLGSGPADPESWRWLAESVLGTGARDGVGLRGAAWSERRNKVKALAGAVRGGPEEVRGLVGAWRVAAPELSLPDGLGDDGFLHAQRTPLLDAIELLDLHLPLDEVGP